MSKSVDDYFIIKTIKPKDIILSKTVPQDIYLTRNNKKYKNNKTNNKTNNKPKKKIDISSINDDTELIFEMEV